MEIFKESTAQKDKFRSAANKLLNQCFIVKTKDDLRADYIFILQNRSYFSEYFELLGYELHINENSGVIGLQNFHGSGRLRLKKIESILLLILRLLYIEKKKELALNDEVIILAEDIHARYNMLKIDAKSSIDKTTLRDTIRLFRRYNIVANIDTDVTYPDARIRIFPSVMFALSGDSINELQQAMEDRLSKYMTGGEVASDQETDENQAD